MAKNYKVLHLTDQQRTKEIEKEIMKTKGIRFAIITDDLKELDIVADNEDFSTIMYKVVNICRKISPGCELSYMF